MALLTPEGYASSMGILETEKAIKQIKDYFERALGNQLNLMRVSAPFLVLPQTGLNDYLNGVERPVSFDMKDGGDTVEVVQSLAKWKRDALKKYGFKNGDGLYTDMNAIRRDEDLDNLHSIYVDQWDWEKIITREERTEEMLMRTVTLIYEAFLQTEAYLYAHYPPFGKILPEKLFFITTQELEDLYPQMTPKQREDAICKKYGAVFIQKIGGVLKSGLRHDGRSPDYDDWELNGDLLLWYPLLNIAVEVTSMGVRVDDQTMLSQLKTAGCEDRLKMKYHKDIVAGNLPYSIGGGIGQSRICMFFLRKAHIGEVQAGVWPQAMIEKCLAANIHLL